MAGDNLVATLRPGPHDQRLRNPHLLDAVHQSNQIRRGPLDGVRLSGIGVNLTHGNIQDALVGVLLPFLLTFEQIIE